MALEGSRVPLTEMHRSALDSQTKLSIPCDSDNSHLSKSSTDCDHYENDTTNSLGSMEIKLSNGKKIVLGQPKEISFVPMEPSLNSISPVANSEHGKHESSEESISKSSEGTCGEEQECVEQEPTCDKSQVCSGTDVSEMEVHSSLKNFQPPSEHQGSVEHNVMSDRLFSGANIPEKEVDPSFNNSQQPPVNSEEGTVDSRCDSGEETRGKRRLRKRVHQDDFALECPICSLSLRTSDLEGHIATEMERLGRVARNSRKSSSALEAQSTGKKKVCKSRKSKDAPPVETPSTPHNRYQTYLSIRYNREKRALAEKKRQSGEQRTNCPVCNRSISGTDEELSQHVNRCLNGEADDYEEEVDVEGEEEQNYEEYTWAGQTRVRATSMLEGGVSELGSVGHKASAADDESDSDLDVDGDDSTLFGSGQYSEADLLPCGSEEGEEEKGRAAIRKALLQGQSRPQNSHSAIDKGESRFSGENQPGPSSRDGGDHERSGVEDSCSQPQAGPSDRSPYPRSQTMSLSRCVLHHHFTSPYLMSSAGGIHVCNRQGAESVSVIASLKAKVLELQGHIDSTEKMKCLICMDSYMKPLVSVQCWHVYCEECWMRTLGAKKLCPQCNMITSPGDLRRIFL